MPRRAGPLDSAPATGEWSPAMVNVATDHTGTTATCSSRAELKAALTDLD